MHFYNSTKLNNDCFQTGFPNALLLVDSPALNSHHWLSQCCCCQEDQTNRNIWRLIQRQGAYNFKVISLQMTFSWLFIFIWSRREYFNNKESRLWTPINITHRVHKCTTIHTYSAVKLCKMQNETKLQILQRVQSNIHIEYECLNLWSSGSLNGKKN